MSKPLLSAEEIQDLLRQPGRSGPVRHLWEGEAQPFNLFAAASKIEEKLVLAEAVHQQLLAPFGQSLSTQCHVTVTVDYAGQQFRPVRDVLAETAVDQCFPVHFEEVGLALEGLVLCERPLFFLLYNQVLGGMRDFTKQGDLTRFERSFFDRMIAPFLQALSEAWKPCGVATFAMRDLFTTQEQLAGLSWVFDAVQARFTCALEKKNAKGEPERTPLGALVLVLPKELLALLGESPTKVQEVQMGAQQAVRTADPLWIEAVQAAVADLPVHVEVGLGSAQAIMQHVLHMTPGLVFPFSAPDDGHPVVVRGRDMFRASLGQAEDRRAVQVEQRVG